MNASEKNANRRRTIAERLAADPPVALESIVTNTPLLLSEARVSELLGISRSRLRKWRSEGYLGNGTEPIPYIVLGGRIFYPREGIIEWLNNQPRFLNGAQANAVKERPGNGR